MTQLKSVTLTLIHPYDLIYTYMMQVDLTLWTENAQKFDENVLNNNPIVALRGARVSNFSGFLSCLYHVTFVYCEYIDICVCRSVTEFRRSYDSVA